MSAFANVFSFAGLFEAIRTASPVRHLRLVDLIAATVAGNQARCRPGRTIDVNHAAARAANQMMVVIADAILEERR